MSDSKHKRKCGSACVPSSCKSTTAAPGVSCVEDHIPRVKAPHCCWSDWEPSIPRKKKFCATTLELGDATTSKCQSKCGGSAWVSPSGKSPLGALGVACAEDCIQRVNEPDVERDWEPSIPRKKKFCATSLDLDTTISKCKPKLKCWRGAAMVSSGKSSMGMLVPRLSTRRTRNCRLANGTRHVSMPRRPRKAT